MELRYLLTSRLSPNSRASLSSEKASRCSARYRQIKTLEEELEVKLLVRTKRSVKLTAAGHGFLREAKDILNRVEQSRVEARRAAQGETGTLSIGFFGPGSSLFLPELIHAYPAVRIHLHEQTSRQQLDALESGRFTEGPRNLLGEDPILVGSHVSELRTDEGKSAGEQIVRWTQRRDDNLTLVVSKEDELLGRLQPGKSAEEVHREIELIEAPEITEESPRV